LCAAQNNQTAPSTLGIDTVTYHKYRIEIDGSGNATFYIDGVLVASLTAAVATTAVLCGSVGTFSEITSGSQTVDIDYMFLQQLRA
jgi:uncharacterized Zn-binding protein involved in type VI secretion